ncbi:MAG: hypothetical protein ACLP8X_27915, partial [Streptosporangiaceae bacterium]
APAHHGVPSWRGEPAVHAPVNPGHTKAEMGYLRSVYHQNRSVSGRHAGATDGTLAEARDNPEASFDGQELDTPMAQ